MKANCRLSARRNRAPQFERRVDLADRLERAPGAADRDIAVVENAPKQRLVDIDAFDLLHVHLDRVAADEAALENDAAVGHRDFRRRAAKPRPHETGDSQEGEDREKTERDGLEAKAVKMHGDGQCEQSRDRQPDCLPEYRPGQGGSVNDLLSRLEYAVDVVHEWLSGSGSRQNSRSAAPRQPKPSSALPGN